MTKKRKKKLKFTIPFTILAVPFNFLVAAVKILGGVLFSSAFMIINGFYNFGVACAKFIALKTHGQVFVRNAAKTATGAVAKKIDAYQTKNDGNIRQGNHTSSEEKDVNNVTAKDEECAATEETQKNGIGAKLTAFGAKTKSLFSKAVENAKTIIAHSENAPSQNNDEEVSDTTADGNHKHGVRQKMENVNTRITEMTNNALPVIAGKMESTSVSLRLKNDDIQFKAYRIIALILLAIGGVYLGFSAKMFVTVETYRYPRFIAIIIATVSFTEVVLAFRGIIISRKIREPVYEAIKCVNLSTSLISLVLTQVGILSTTGIEKQSFYNGLAGITLGSAVLIISIFMLIREHRLRTGKSGAVLFRRVQHALRASKCDVSVSCALDNPRKPQAVLFFGMPCNPDKIEELLDKKFTLGVQFDCTESDLVVTNSAP